MRTRFLSIFCFIFFPAFLSSQNKTIDSLNTLLKTSKLDTVRIHTLNELSWEVLMVGNDKEAMSYAKQALALAKKDNFLPGEAASLHAIGIVFDHMEDDSSAIDSYTKALKINDGIGRRSDAARQLANIAISYSNKGDFKQSLFYGTKALKIGEELNDKERISTQHINLGGVNFRMGDYPGALDHFLKAFKIHKELGDKNGQLGDLGNIGVVYKAQKDYKKALEYYFQSLKLSEEEKDQISIAKNLSNIGNIYSRQNDLDKAIEYHFKSLKIYEEAGNKRGIAGETGNLGSEFDTKGDYDKAFEYYFRSQKIREELGSKGLIATNLGNIGGLYAKKKQFAKAEEYMLKDLQVSNETGSLSDMQAAHRYLTELYEEIHQDAKALEHYKKFIQLKDSIFNEDNTKKLVRSEMNFEFDKKQAIDKLEQEKKEALAADELKRQKLFTYACIGGGILVLMLLIVSYRGYRVKQKTNIEITRQKEIIEEKNKEVHDSITYAKRIQTAILPPDKLIKQYLPDSFVLFKPKDIVSGDFYWLETVRTKVLFAAVDCTGHGVPGAMVSVVGNSGLNRAVKEFGLSQPAAILDKLTQLVEETFAKSESEVKDGMDISLCCMDRSNNVLEWAGANNPLWIIRNGVLENVKADKQPIGAFEHRKPFTNHSIQLNKGDAVYIFTDGYADQFGGEKGKKFKYKQLEELLIASQNISVGAQSELLNNAFEDWKGPLEQVDDVCIMGLRV